MWCDLAENRLDSGLFSFEISLPDYLDPCAFHPPPCIPSLPLFFSLSPFLPRLSSFSAQPPKDSSTKRVKGNHRSLHFPLSRSRIANSLGKLALEFPRERAVSCRTRSRCVDQFSSQDGSIPFFDLRKDWYNDTVKIRYDEIAFSRRKKFDTV